MKNPKDNPNTPDQAKALEAATESVMLVVADHLESHEEAAFLCNQIPVLLKQRREFLAKFGGE